RGIGEMTQGLQGDIQKLTGDDSRIKGAAFEAPKGTPQEAEKTKAAADAAIKEAGFYIQRQEEAIAHAKVPDLVRVLPSASPRSSSSLTDWSTAADYSQTDLGEVSDYRRAFQTKGYFR